jgi:hypothetical protein
MGSFANEMKNSILEPYTSSLRPHLSQFHPKDRMRLSGAGEAHGIMKSFSRSQTAVFDACRIFVECCKKFQSKSHHITTESYPIQN